MRSPERRRRLTTTAVLLSALSTVGSVLLPVLGDSLLPPAQDLAVPLGLTVAAAAAARAPTTAVLLALAGALWAVTGLAGQLGGTWGPLVERAAMWPHACVLAAMLSLPHGTLRTGRLTAALAGAAVALLAGAGVGLPAFALLAGASAVGAVSWGGDVRTSAERFAQVALGAGATGWLVAAALSDVLSVRALANLVDVLLLGSAVLVVQGTRLDRATGAVTVEGELGRRVGGVLGTAPVRVDFLVDGGYVDLSGWTTRPDADATHLQDSRGRVVGAISPGGDLPAYAGRLLAEELGPLADVAALQHRRRLLAADLVTSRRRLAVAEDRERHRVERVLSHTVLPRLDALEVLLADEPEAGDGLTRLRDELASLVAGLDPLRGLTLGEALAGMAGRVARIDVPPGLDAPPEVARAAWWIAAEAVTNALKHAPGATVTLTARRSDEHLHVRVSDDGPGGADGGGRGLLGIADRAAVVGGRLDVESGAAGTTISTVLPLLGTGSPVPTSRSGPDPGEPVRFLASRT